MLANEDCLFHDLNLRTAIFSIKRRDKPVESYTETSLVDCSQESLVSSGKDKARVVVASGLGTDSSLERIKEAA